MKFGKDGEWAQSRVLQVQFQNVKGNDVGQFRDISTQVVVAPAGVRVGQGRLPVRERQEVGRVHRRERPTFREMRSPVGDEGRQRNCAARVDNPCGAFIMAALSRENAGSDKQAPREGMLLPGMTANRRAMVGFLASAFAALTLSAFRPPPSRASRSRSASLWR